MLDYSRIVPSKPSSVISTPALLLPQRFEVVGGFDPDEFDKAAAEWHLRKTFVQNGLAGIVHELFGIMPSNGNVLKDREFVDKLDKVEFRKRDEIESDECDEGDSFERDKFESNLCSLPLPLQRVDADEAFFIAARIIYKQYKEALSATILARQNTARKTKKAGLIEFANRYGFLGRDKGINRGSIFNNFAVIRAVDAIRILRKADRLKLCTKANKALDGLIANDEEVLSSKAFESATCKWDHSALEEIVESFGVPVVALLNKCGSLDGKERRQQDFDGEISDGLNSLLVESLQPYSKQATQKSLAEETLQTLLNGTRPETKEERLRRKAAAAKFEELRKKGFVMDVKEDAAREERIKRRIVVENLKELVLLAGLQLSDPALEGVGAGGCDKLWGNGKTREELQATFLKGLKRTYLKLARQVDEVLAGAPPIPEEKKAVHYNDLVIADAWLRDLKDFEVESSFWNAPAA